MIIHTPKELAAVIKSCRKTQKLSQKHIANLVAMKQATISAFEKKPNTTKLDTLFRILAATNLEMQILPKDTARNQNNWNEEW